MIIVNTPHNPVGKVFTKSELESIAAIAEEFNLLVMADEVVRPDLCLYLCFKYNSFISMTASSSMAKSTFALQIYLACGTVQLRWDLQEVSMCFCHRIELRLILSSSVHRRGICSDRMAYWLAHRSKVNYTTNVSSEHKDRILFKFSSSGSCGFWSRTGP